MPAKFHDTFLISPNQAGIENSEGSLTATCYRAGQAIRPDGSNALLGTQFVD